MESGETSSALPMLEANTVDIHVDDAEVRSLHPRGRQRVNPSPADGLQTEDSHGID